MEEWKTYKIGSLCSISSSKRIFAKEYQPSGIPFYRGKEVIEKQKGETVSTELYISKSRYDEIKNKFGVPKEGDMLLTSVGTLGIPYVVKNETFYFKDGNLTWFSNFKGINSKFLYYWFLSPMAKSTIDTNAIGSTQKALTIDVLSKFEIDIPNIETQEKIVSFFSSLDSKIELNRRINDNLEQQAQALFKSWFVDFEPFKDGKFVESEMGMIPEGWKVVQLGEIIEISKRFINPQKNPDKIFYHYSLPACDNGLIPEIQSGKDIMSNKIILQNNTILFSKLNPRIKRIWFACDVLNDSICSTEFIPYRAKNERESVYIYSIINSDSFYASVLGCVNGATGSHQRFHAEDTLGLLFPYKKDIVDKYIDLVKPVLTEIHKLRIENKTLALTRDSLLPRLMSGELKINDLNC